MARTKDRAPGPAADKTWIDVAGYRHETVHTGALWALLEDPVIGPRLAADLTDWAVAEVISVNREHKIARRKADLVAYLRLEDGDERVLAVETKVHSNGSRDQLTGTTEGCDHAAGVLLAVGFSALKMSRWDIDEMVSAGVPWKFVDAAGWLDLLRPLGSSIPWLSPYRNELKRWSKLLGDGRKHLGDERLDVELQHLRWFSEMREHLCHPAAWQPIVTRQSGTLLSLFAWEDGGADLYLEAMGFWSGRRQLHLKVGGSAAGVARLRETGLEISGGVAELRPPSRAFSKGQKSATVGIAEYGEISPLEAARLTDRIEKSVEKSVASRLPRARRN